MTAAIAFISETNKKSGISKELEEEFINIIEKGLIFTKISTHCLPCHGKRRCV